LNYLLQKSNHKILTKRGEYPISNSILYSCDKLRMQFVNCFTA